MCRSVQPQVDLTKYNPIFTENPEKIASRLKWKTLGYNVLEKVTLVAMVALTAFVLCVSLGLGAAISWLPTAAFCSALGAAGLSMVLPKLRDKVAVMTGQRDMAQRIADKYKEISGFSTQQIGDELKKMGITKHQIQIKELKEIQADDPLRAKIPILAHLAVHLEERGKAQKMIADGLAFKAEDGLENGEQLVWAENRAAWRCLVQHEVPASMQAALMIHILKNPTCQQVSIRELGDIRPKDLDIMILDAKFRNDENYFIPVNKRPKIKFDQVITKDFESIDPIEMEKILFQRLSL